MRIAVALALAAVLVGACGDDGDAPATDAPTIDGPTDADVDGPPPTTFTSFVIDQIQSHTLETNDPVAFTTFSTLDDPDQDNPAAYAVLFN